jgi:hypothetical protein
MKICPLILSDGHPATENVQSSGNNQILEGQTDDGEIQLLAKKDQSRIRSSARTLSKAPEAADNRYCNRLWFEAFIQRRIVPPRESFHGIAHGSIESRHHRTFHIKSRP